MFDREEAKLFKQTILIMADNIRAETSVSISADDAVRYALAIKLLTQAYREL